MAEPHACHGCGVTSPFEHSEMLNHGPSVGQELSKSRSLKTTGKSTPTILNAYRLDIYENPGATPARPPAAASRPSSAYDRGDAPSPASDRGDAPAPAAGLPAQPRAAVWRQPQPPGTAHSVPQPRVAQVPRLSRAVAPCPQSQPPAPAGHSQPTAPVGELAVRMCRAKRPDTAIRNSAGAHSRPKSSIQASRTGHIG